MKITTKKENLLKSNLDLIVLPAFEKKTNPAFKNLPTEIKKEINNLLKKKLWKGDLGETRAINTLGKIKARNILLVGLGKEKDYSLEILRRVIAIVLKVTKHLKLERMGLDLNQFSG